MPRTRDLFDASEKETIRRAVDEAEGRTAGEIVPFVVGASDEYESAFWKGAVLGGLAVALVAAVGRELVETWASATWLWLIAPTMIGVAAGMFASTLVPLVKRTLVTEEIMDKRCRRRAALAFVEEEVFATRDRTGILIFLSLFERRVVILGDSGINARVEEAEWQEISDDLAAGIRAGRAAAALVEAIDRCGELLERKGVAIRPDDTDELADDLRLRDR